MAASQELIDTILAGDIQKVNALQKDIDDPEVHRSALSSAVEKGDTAILGHLLPSKTFLEGEWTSFGSRLLLNAYRNTDIPTIRLLLEHGANPYAPDDIDEVPPIEAVLGINHGTWVKNKKASPASTAEVLGLFLDYKIWETKRWDPATMGISSLLAAVTVGRIEVVRRLIASGADVNSYALDDRDDAIKFPLDLAWSLQNREMVRELLSLGADPYKRIIVHDELSCVMVSIISSSDTELIKLVLKAGCGGPMPKDIHLLTMAFANTVDDEELQRLLEDAASSDWKVPLTGDSIGELMSKAICLGHTEIVRILLNHVQDVNDNIPIHILEKEHYRCGNFFRARQRYFKDHPEERFKRPPKDRIKRLPDSCSPLEMAIWNRNEPVCDLFFEHGADVNHSSTTAKFPGRTPLILSCCRDTNLIPYLLRKGANPNLQDAEGYTPFHNLFCPQKRSRFGIYYRVDTLTCLLKHGANINLRNNDGATPLDILQKYLLDDNSIVKYCLLLYAGAECAQQDAFIPVGPNRALAKFIQEMNDYLRRGKVERCGRNLLRPFYARDRLEALIRPLITTGSANRRAISEIYESTKDVDDDDFNDIKAYMRQFLDNGYTLKEMCRLKIRKTIGQPLVFKVRSDKFVYPSLLKDYILCTAECTQ